MSSLRTYLYFSYALLLLREWWDVVGVRNIINILEDTVLFVGSNSITITETEPVQVL